MLLVAIYAKRLPLTVSAVKRRLSASPIGDSALAAPWPLTKQVTGPVLEVTDSYIVVQKGEDKWQIARDANTKGGAGKVEKNDRPEKKKQTS